MYCGYMVLYFVCKNDKYYLCVVLLFDDNNVKLLLEKKLN